MNAEITLARSLPVVEGAPLWGVLPRLLRQPLELYAEAASLGDLVKLRLPFGRAYFVSTPELIREVMQRRADIFERPPALRSILQRLGGDNLMTREGPAFLSRRRLLQPSFQRAEILKRAADVVAAVDAVLDTWEMQIGRTFCMRDKLVELTQEVVARTLLGASLTRFPSLASAFTTITRYIQYRAATPLAPPLWLPTRRHRELRRALRNLDATTDLLLTEKRHARGANTDLLSVLLQARDPDTGHGLTDEQLRREVQMLIGAGETTTGNALSFCFSLLGRHPEWLASVVRQIDEVVGATVPNVAHLVQLPLLRQVLDETLRLYPPSYVVARAATVATVLGGIQLTRGDVVLFSPYILHRDPRFWNAPNTFRPERFAVGGEADTAPRCAYLPFGAGPRRCIGENLAQLEMLLAITRILQRYDLALPTGAPPELDAGFVLAIAGALPVRLRARSSASRAA